MFDDIGHENGVVEDVSVAGGKCTLGNALLQLLDARAFEALDGYSETEFS